MRIHLIAVGRLKSGPERALFEHYAGRLRLPLEVREVEEKRPLPVPDRIQREGEMILAAVPASAVCVALDEDGSDLSSNDFAARLAGWQEAAVADLAFLVGGADGHAAAVRTRADLKLAFGRPTWPHMLVRAMLAEQLYRAQQIQIGHPYHRG